MDFGYTLPSPQGHYYYATCQLAALAVFVGLLLGQGHRRGYAWRSWLPLVAAATLALVLGCQLVFLPLSAWPGWLLGNAALRQAVAEGPRSVVGGVAASWLAVVVLRRVLGFRGWTVLDAFAQPLCWALAVQCVGCLLAGCCWGEATADGWGLRYGPGTPVYVAQVAQGLVPSDARHTLPVVPTQLYHLLLCAGTGLLLHGLRRRTAYWPGGSHYLLAMGLLCLGRFGIEFLRDPAGEPLLGATLLDGPLLGIQALLLLETALLLGAWRWLATRPAAAGPEVQAAPTGIPALVGLGVVVVASRFGPGLLSWPELVVLHALLALVVLVEGYTWLARIGRPAPRLAGLPLGVLLLSVLLGTMAQAPAPQPGSSGKTVTISAGVLGNYHEAQEDILNSHDICGSRSEELALRQRVRAAGGEVAVTTTTDENRTSTVGGGVWVGPQQVEAHPVTFSRYSTLVADTTFHYQLADVHFYNERHGGEGWLSYGFRVGMHLGSLGYYSYFDGGNARSTAVLMPELMASLGNPRLLYGQADFCYGAENTLGACTSRVALGSGLGQVGGSQVLAGYAHSAHSPSQDMGFVSASLRLPGNTGLSALSLEPYFATNFGRHQLFSLKVSYRLGGK